MTRDEGAALIVAIEGGFDGAEGVWPSDKGGERIATKHHSGLDFKKMRMFLGRTIPVPSEIPKARRKMYRGPVIASRAASPLMQPSPPSHLELHCIRDASSTNPRKMPRGHR